MCFHDKIAVTDKQLKGLWFFAALSGAPAFVRNTNQNNNLKIRLILKSIFVLLYNKNIRQEIK